MSAPELAGLAVLIPLLGAILIALCDRRPNVREGVTLVTASLLFLCVLGVLPDVAAGARPSLVIAKPVPGLPLVLEVEPLGMLFALIASFLWIVTSLYSIGYMRAHHERNQTRFYVCFAVALSSTVGVAFAGNMLTLFFFYEVLTLSTYPLVAHAGTEEAKRGARVYIGILLATSIGMQLLAIVWTWVVAGTLTFEPGGILADKVSPAVGSVLLALYVFGTGKAAIMPFHRWLPAAMVAPTPVSALLHAVAVVKAGVFTVVKVAIYIFGLDFLAELAASRWLLYLAAATILIASLVAMRQDNLKLRLAYSTVSQLSYVLLGALLANSLGVVGGGLHIAMHAFGKITLFFCAGAILVAAHKSEIREMNGLGRSMPITMGAFFVASLSVIGLPPLGGTWSKWLLALAALEADQPIFIAVLLLSSLLNVAYLLPIPIRGFLAPPNGHAHSGIKEAPAFCLVALLVTAAISTALFFFPDPIWLLLSKIA